MKVKDKLINQIKGIENEQLMSSISSMLSSMNEDGIFELSDSFITLLKSRSNSISKGQFKTHDEVKNHFSK